MGATGADFVASAIIAVSGDTLVPPWPAGRLTASPPGFLPPVEARRKVTPPPPPPLPGSALPAGDVSSSPPDAAGAGVAAGAFDATAAAEDGDAGAAFAGVAAAELGAAVGSLATGATFGGRVATTISAATAAMPSPATTASIGPLAAAVAAGAAATGLLLAGAPAATLGELAGADFAAGRDDGDDGADGGGGMDGVSSSNSGADASGVVFARASPPGSAFAICFRSTMPESCPDDDGGGGATEGGAGVFAEGVPSVGELASFARSWRLRRSRDGGGHCSSSCLSATARGEPPGRGGPGAASASYEFSVFVARKSWEPSWLFFAASSPPPRWKAGGHPGGLPLESRGAP